MDGWWRSLETNCLPTLEPGHSHLKMRWYRDVPEAFDLWESLRSVAPLVAGQHDVSAEDLVLGE